MSSYVDVTAAYKHHTVRAVLVEIGENDNRWIPRSQLDLEDLDLEDLREGQLISFQVQQWWAEREGLV